MRNPPSLLDLRVIAFAGIAFIAVLSGQNYESQRRLEAQSAEQRADVVSRAEKIAASLIDERKQRLTLFTELLATTASIPSLMRYHPQQSVRLEEVLSQFIISAEASKAYFFDANGTSLLDAYPTVEAETLARKSFTNKSPESLIVCEKAECVHYVAVPVLLNGRDAGVIVASYEMHEVFRTFESATGAKIAIHQCHRLSDQEKKEGMYEVDFRDTGNRLPRDYCYRVLFDTSKDDQLIEKLRRQNFMVSIVGAIVLAIFLLVLYLFNLRHHQRIIQKGLEAKRKKADTLDRVSKNFENERRALAAELHDELGQRLVPIRFNVTILRSMAEEKGCTDLVEVAKSVESGFESLSKGVSSLLNSLRPPLLDTMGLRGSLESIADEFRFAMPDCEIKINYGELVNLDVINDAAQVVIYRVVQESLTNISKHAPTATRINIDILCTIGGLQISVSDNGPGIHGKDRSIGMGLRGMQERVSAINGEFTVKSDPGNGTTILIEIPCGEQTCCEHCQKR